MKLKLSELPDDVEVSSIESSTVYTVAEVKQEIIDLGEPHHESPNWYTVKRKRWSADAKWMIESYIDSEYDNMYEDWDERAKDCITDDVINQIQAILDEAFKGDSVAVYWDYDNFVEIDVFPNKN